jgi:hypothetical protein
MPVHSVRARIALCVLFASGIVACTPEATPTPPQPRPSPFLVKASIREIMDAEVDPAADALWDAVAFYATLQGSREQQPRTPAEWQAVRRNAITLLEATNLIVMQGRQIAPPDTAVAPGEMEPALLQRKLNANPAAFIGFAQALRAVTLKALDAIDARDPQRLFEAGGEIDQACEACHLVYWYPPDAKATLAAPASTTSQSSANEH